MRPRHLIYYALYVIGLLLLMRWSNQHGDAIPKWVLVVALLPMLWVGMRQDRDLDEDDSTLARGARAFGHVYLVVAALFAMVLGGVGLALKGSGSLLEAFGFFMPIGAVVLAAALISWWLRGRDS